MSKPHIILLGDRTKAARWVGYAEGQFELQVEKYGPNFQTAIFPKMDISIEMRMFGGVRKIIITARPPVGARFVGTPYDALRYGGWGSPYESADEFGNANPTTSGGIPYGTEFSEDDKAVLIGGGRKALWKAQRHPEYLKEFPDLKYGTIDWISSDLNNSISWDGLNSRHKHVVPNVDDVFHGYWEGSCLTGLNEGLLFIGQVITKGNLCVTPTQPYQYGLYRVINVHKNAAQDVGDYDYEFAISNNVYKDGDVLWSDAKDRYVSAAALVYKTNNEGSRYRELRAVVCEYDEYRGAYKDHLVIYNLTDDELITDRELEYYGNDEVALIDNNRSSLLPYANTNTGAFSGDGNKLLLLRDFYSLNGSEWIKNTKVTEYIIAVDDSESSGSSGELSGISLTPEGAIVVSSTVLWDNRTTKGAPTVYKEEDDQSLPGYARYKAYVKGDVVIAADYAGSEIVYAYVNTKQSEEFIQNLDQSGACDEYVLDQINLVYEYLWFSLEPEKHIFLRQEDLRRNTRINISKDPDMLYRKTFLIWNISELNAVDARYAAAIVLTSTSNSWWQLRKANDGGTESLVKYEPFEAITQDFVTAGYLNGDLIFETAPERTYISFLFSSSIPKSYTCQMIVEQFDLYELNSVAYAKSTLEPISHSDNQIVPRAISGTIVDMIMHYRAVSYAYLPVNILLRYDTLNKAIIKQKELSDILQIAEYYNHEDELLISVHGGYGNIGLL